MYQPLDDHAKRRLIEPRDIAVAVRILKAEGIDRDDLLGEITKLFYVDLDAFNDVINASHEQSLQAPTLMYAGHIR
jgi:hypothetical protein